MKEREAKLEHNLSHALNGILSVIPQKSSINFVYFQHQEEKLMVRTFCRCQYAVSQTTKKQRCGSPRKCEIFGEDDSITNCTFLLKENVKYLVKMTIYILSESEVYSTQEY